MLTPCRYKAHRAAVLSALILFLGLHLCTVVSPSVVAAVGPARVATDPLYFARANGLEGLILLGLFFPVSTPLQKFYLAGGLGLLFQTAAAAAADRPWCWLHSLHLSPGAQAELTLFLAPGRLASVMS